MPNHLMKSEGRGCEIATSDLWTDGGDADVDESQQQQQQLLLLFYLIHGVIDCR